MFTVEGPALVAVVNPDRGAKITSLRGRDGYEWLVQAPSDDVPARGRAFIEAEMAGWDECAPTVNACELDGRALPGHGDLWDTEFSVEADGVTVTAVGHSLGYRFRRRIVPTPAGLRFEYEATALDGPTPFLWVAHPQFAAPPGTRVELDGVERVVDVQVPQLTEHPWRPELATIDTVPAGDSRKVYADPEHAVHAARLVHGSGRTLTMRWSAECPYVGVWFDAARYSREPVIAIEPATGYFDSAAVARDLGRLPQIEKGETLAWWLEVEA